MDSKSRVPTWILVFAMATVAGSVIVAGVRLDKNGARSESVINRIGGHGGDMVEPKRCLLRVAILSRPFGDPLVNQAVWADADEQIVAPQERRAWEVNGLRIGRIIGQLPHDVQALLEETSPNKKVTPATFFVESGEANFDLDQRVGRASQPALKPREPRLRPGLRRGERLLPHHGAARGGTQHFVALRSRDPSRTNPAHLSAAVQRLRRRTPTVPDQRRTAGGDAP